MARLHLGQGTLSTRLPFQDRMVGVSTLNLQKKCILVAEKSCYLQEQSSKLFFSLREFLFSLIKLFFFSIWTVKTSLRSVLTTIQISKKKELIAEKKKFLSEKKLRMRALPFQCNAFPATKKIYSQFQNCFHLPLFIAFFWGILLFPRSTGLEMKSDQNSVKKTKSHQFY